MNKSESITKLAEALHKAQGDMKAAIKDATNPHFKSKYADLGAVVDAVKSPLLKHGITFLQGVQDAENGVAVETMLLHTSGEWISSTLRLPAQKQDAQGYGSAITYGRRYGLQAMCGIPSEDDDGNAASRPSSAKPVTQDVWDNLSTDEQTWLNDIAQNVRNELNQKGPEAALAVLEEQGLSADHKVAIWSRFSSSERSAMKNQPKKAA